MATVYRLGARFYATVGGNEPVRDWIKRLTKKDKKLIGEDIKTVQIGWPLGMPLVRKIDTDVWEVRTDITDGISRVLFTVVGGNMILLHAIVKKTTKLPLADKNLAIKRKGEVKKR